MGKTIRVITITLIMMPAALLSKDYFFSWEPNPEPIEYYNLCWANSPENIGADNNRCDTTTDTSITIYDIDDDKRFFFAVRACLTSGHCSDFTPVALNTRTGIEITEITGADYDGDGIPDISAKTSDGFWVIDYSSVKAPSGDDFNKPRVWDSVLASRGNETAHPVPGDYDGDGITDISVKTDNGRWLIDYGFNGFYIKGGWDEWIYSRGGPAAHPVPGDYDGDGITDISVKVDDGRWLIDYAYDGFYTQGGWDEWIYSRGGPAAHPVPGDYDGDNVIDIAVKVDDGRWLIDYAINGFYTEGGWDTVLINRGDIRAHPIPGDYDGDSITDISVKTDSGRWLIDYGIDGFHTERGWDFEMMLF